MAFGRRLQRSSKASSVAQTPDTGLFFKLPTNIRTYNKKAFALYFSPYNISRDNEVYTDDAYKNYFLNPLGESSRKYAEGGLWRDRPLPTDPKSDYMIQNARTEIQQAINAGIDGFFADILGVSGLNWNNLMALKSAANTYFPGFYIIPLLDGSGSTVDGGDSATCVTAISSFLNQSSSFYTPDGKFLVASFQAEVQPESWWQGLLSSVQSNYGVACSFAAVFLNYNSSSASYLNVTDIGGAWGMGSDPGVISNYSDVAGTAKSRGQYWMQPVTPQNVRPSQHWFDEAANTGALRASWNRAINDNADYVQIVTWCDYSENTQLAPSAANGYVNCDLTAYYLSRWKTGTAPPILRDAMYLSHRNQLLSATPQFESSAPMTQRSQSNMTTARNTVEVLTYFLQPATVTVHIGSNTYTYTAPAGENVQLYTMVNGNISASATRSGSTIASITSPIGCMVNPPVQDRIYYRFSSLRSTSTYFVPSNLDGV